MSTEQIETAAREIYNLVADHEASHWSECGEATRLEMLAAARAVIAAIHPTVSSTAELDALPVGSAIIDGDGDVARREEGGLWTVSGSGSVHDSDLFTLPATVLHMGGAA